MNVLNPCNSASHITRRTLLQTAGLGGLAWLTPVAHLLGRAQEKEPAHAPAKVGHHAVDGRRPKPVGNIRPARGRDNRRRHPRHRHLRQRRETRPRPPASGRGDGRAHPRALDGQQRRRPRTRHVQRQNRLPARPHFSASIHWRRRLPRAARCRNGHPAPHFHFARPMARPRRLPRRTVRRLQSLQHQRPRRKHHRTRTTQAARQPPRRARSRGAILRARPPPRPRHQDHPPQYHHPKGSCG